MYPTPSCMYLVVNFYHSLLATDIEYELVLYNKTGAPYR